MNGLFDAILYTFCIKVLQGKASKDEMDFFARVMRVDYGLGFLNASDEDWERMVRYVSEAVAKSEFPDNDPHNEKAAMRDMIADLLRYGDFSAWERHRADDPHETAWKLFGIDVDGLSEDEISFAKTSQAVTHMQPENIPALLGWYREHKEELDEQWEAFKQGIGWEESDG